MKSFKKTNNNQFDTDLMTGSIDEGFFQFRYNHFRRNKQQVKFVAEVDKKETVVARFNLA